MSAYTKTRIIYSPIGKTYAFLLDFIETLQKGKNDLKVRLTDSKEPSYIKAKIPYGFLDICITSQDEKSLIKLNFDFKKYLYLNYAHTILGIVLFTLIGLFWNPGAFMLALVALAFAFYPSQTVKSVGNKFMDRFDLYHKSVEITAERTD